jgi:predicted transcriptional regulator
MPIPKVPLSRSERRLFGICCELGGEPTAQEIHRIAQSRYEPRQYVTTCTVLDRCVKKGYLGQRMEKGIRLYLPLVPREPVARLEVAEILDDLSADRDTLISVQELIARRLAEIPGARRQSRR